MPKNVYPNRTPRSRGPNYRKLASWAVYLGIAGFILALLVFTRTILLPFVIALLIAYILEPAVTRLHKKGFPRFLGVIAVYVAVIGSIATFVYFLVPIVDVESKKFAKTFSTAVKSAPKMYEGLESEVGALIDSISTSDQGSVPGSGAVAPEDQWGFGPALQRLPSVSPTSLATIQDLTFDSSPQEYAAAGLDNVPTAQGGRIDAVTQQFKPAREPDSALTVEMQKPGSFGIKFGKTPIEVRKSGDGAWVLSSGQDQGSDGSMADLKNQVISAMRTGLQQISTSLLNGLLGFFQGLVSGLLQLLVGLVIVFLVGAFAMMDGPAILRLAKENVPRRWRDDLTELLDRLDKGLSGVVRGQLLICLVNGVLSTIGFLIFIPEYAVVLGILAGLLSLVPIFGTIISSAPAVLIAMSISFGHAVGVLAWILGIHFVEAYILNPNIIGHHARIHPILVVFVLILGESFFGLTGILLAVPATSLIQTVILFAWSRAKRQVL